MSRQYPVSCLLGLCLLSFPFFRAGAAQPLDVKDFGAIVDDGKDDSAAFAAALEKAGKDGATVTIPAGHFRLDSPIAIPRGARLEGTGRTLRASHLDRGTVLELYWGRGKEDATACIQLDAGASLAGVTLYFPEQTVEEPTPYPWAVQGQGVTPFVTNPPGSSQHYSVENVVIVNAWNAVDCGTYHNEGHFLRNVQICALKTGVYVDNCSDVGRLENVHIHNVYWWRAHFPEVLNDEQRKALEEFTMANLTGFKIGRTDWQFVSNCFVIWAKVGFHFFAGNPKPGYATGRANVLITQSGSDVGPLAVRVDQVQRHAGIAFENCQFMSGLEIGPENEGPVKLVNCGFWGQPGTGSQVILEGSGSLTLMANHFADWDRKEEGLPCIDARAGRLILQGSEFHPQDEDVGPHVRLHGPVTGAAILGNIFRAEAIRIENESTGSVEMVGNIAAS